LITQINGTSSLRLPFFGQKIREFAQRFRAGDANTDRDPGAAFSAGENRNIVTTPTK
jgi:hypothetical protein